MDQTMRAERRHRIAEGIRAGHTQQAIGAALGISGSAICQFIQRDPELRRLKASHAPSELARLKALRTDLVWLRSAVRRELHRLEEELLAYEVDLAIR